MIISREKLCEIIKYLKPFQQICKENSKQIIEYFLFEHNSDDELMKIKKNIYFVNQYDLDLENLINKNNSWNMIETLHYIFHMKYYYWVNQHQ